jgi:hypothetical protein
LPHDASHPDGNHDQRYLSTLRSSIQMADFVELCSAPDDRRRDEFDSLLSGILDQIGQLSEAIAHLYFSHAVFLREPSGIRVDPQA